MDSETDTVVLENIINLQVKKDWCLNSKKMTKLCMIFQQVDENQTEETPVVEKKKEKSTTKK